MEGSAHDNRGQGNPSYMPGVDPGRHGGGTYTQQATEPTLADYENVFGPSARDIKSDLQRYKRHGRWHLPDALKGSNQFLTDRVDGLITDATNSPFTTRILPYKYNPNPDAKLKWNVWSFDEAMASRVPYESAARTLTQTKRSFAGYTVRQGLAIVLEHNFMMSEKGRENFKNQLQQLVGSIQYTNDLDVHVALVLAPSYQATVRDRYYIEDKSPTQVCRDFVDLFGFMQKNQNALDILIEEGKAQLKSWGGPMPDFLLCNSKLTFQLTMTPEKTNYLTQGIDGVKRLRAGPDLASYRGINIIHSRCFSMDPGTPPRDILRRRVRVAEYYRVLPHKDNDQREFQFYNEERDTWFTYSFHDLLKMAIYAPAQILGPGPGATNHNRIQETITHLNTLNSKMDGRSHEYADEMDMEVEQHVPEAHRLAGQMGGGDSIPMHLGAPGTFLGLDADNLTENSERELCYKVAAAAMNPDWVNWDPKGEFISPNFVFAVGAMTWNHFYVRNQNPNKPLPGGGGVAGLGVDVYIPPEKYYFQTIDDISDWDLKPDGANAVPYGLNECQTYRNALLHSHNPRIRRIGTILDLPYANLNPGNITYPALPAGLIPFGAPGAPAIPQQAGAVWATQMRDSAEAEQLRVTAALLFQAICEYPRVTEQFYENPSAAAAITANLDAAFMHGSNVNNNFSESTRFRNWMRYGVCPALVSTTIRNQNGIGAIIPFPGPMAAFRSGSTGQLIPGGGANPPMSFIPWNKITPGTSALQRFRQEPNSAPCHYSAFDIVRGSRSSNMYPNINARPAAAGFPAPPYGFLGPDSPESTTIFGESGDNGVALLREIGAFFAPNHFHVDNDPYKYDSVGSFLGSNVILTSEMLREVCRKRPNHINNTSFMDQTLLLELLLRPHLIGDNFIAEVSRLIKRAWDDNYTNPEEAFRAFNARPPVPPAPAPAPAAGAAPAPAPAPAVAPIPSRFNRLDLTSSFINAVPGAVNPDDLANIINRIGQSIQFTQDHPRQNVLWTWPRVSESGDDLWCQAGTDYRFGNGALPAPGGAPLPVMAGGALAMNRFFPNYQVGNEAVTNWQIHLNTYANTAGVRAPGMAPGALAAAINDPRIIDHHSKWAFSKIIETRPNNVTMSHPRREVMDFFWQIYTRIIEDQSNEPVTHSASPMQGPFIETQIHKDPYSRVRSHEPMYNWSPGGRYRNQFVGETSPLPYENNSGRMGPPGGGGPGGGGGGGPGGGRNPRGRGPPGRPQGPGARNLKDIELVIVRPNIEHHMLGIIMGQGGDNLGNTLWGQTELSCYDDSMHGIWGMSYKYHERAIVFNEKNLIRLWDVAYDGYCGGKDATSVDWTQRAEVEKFRNATNDIAQNYRGQSMMVYAFYHDTTSPDYQQHFKRNWPSPIVYHDDYDYTRAHNDQAHGGNFALTADPSNIHVTNVQDMRVFNSPLYGAYQHYRDHMPNFSSLHKIRKPAGTAAVENETFCDALAFQGTMKTFQGGHEVEHIQGSGHHGPDWVGVASIRSGKGYKIASQPGLQRLV